MTSKDERSRATSPRTAARFGPSPVGAYVGVDDKNSSRYVFNLSQSGTGLPDRSYYLEDRFADARAGYLTFLTTLFDLAHADGVPMTDTAPPAPRACSRSRRSSRVPSGRASRTATPRRPTTRCPSRTSCATYPNLHFDTILAEWASRAASTRSSSRSRRSSRASTASWPPSRSRRGPTTRASARSRPPPACSRRATPTASFDFYGRQLRGQQQDRPRWKKGVSATAGTFGESVGRVYVARHYPQAAADRMDALIGNLREAFRASITDLAWMSPETRQRALDKLNTYTYKIGTPTEWEAYEGLVVSPTDLVGNLRNASDWRYRGHDVEARDRPRPRPSGA